MITLSSSSSTPPHPHPLHATPEEGPSHILTLATACGWGFYYHISGGETEAPYQRPWRDSASPRLGQSGSPHGLGQVAPLSGLLSPGGGPSSAKSQAAWRGQISGPRVWPGLPVGASRAGEAESTLCPEIPHALWAAPVPKISSPSGHGVLRAREGGGEEALPLDDTGVDIWTSAATL